MHDQDSPLSYESQPKQRRQQNVVFCWLKDGCRTLSLRDRERFFVHYFICKRSWHKAYSFIKHIHITSPIHITALVIPGGLQNLKTLYLIKKTLILPSPPPQWQQQHNQMRHLIAFVVFMVPRPAHKTMFLAPLEKANFKKNSLCGEWCSVKKGKSPRRP